MLAQAYRQDACAPSEKGMNLYGAKPDGSRRWYSRGYLSHFDGGEITQFITFRLHDSLPQDVLLGWRGELAGEPETEREILLNRRIEKYLDQGFGECFLLNPEIAAIVQNALLFHDNSLYRLSAWIIMPNHVHLLLTPNAGVALSRILHSLKSFTSNKVNQMLGRKGKLWQEESFDRYIRNREHYEKTITYIENNPVKARLCERPSDWQFSSAFH
ncbi:MAG: transposase [Pyrinomonadaceae bacterium]